MEIYVVFDKEGRGEETVIGARLTHDEAEALRLELVNQAFDELELDDEDDPEEARDECDGRYVIIELGA